MAAANLHKHKFHQQDLFDLNAVKRDSLDWNGTWMKRKLILLLFEMSLALFK